jgi:alanyl-tRNA synthetase
MHEMDTEDIPHSMTPERVERLLAFRTEAHRHVRDRDKGIAELAVLIFMATEDIRERLEHMEDELQQLSNTLEEINAEDSELLTAVTSAGERQKELAEFIKDNISAGTAPTTTQIEELNTRAQASLVSITNATNQLVAETEANKNPDEDGKIVGAPTAEANKPQYTFAGTGSPNTSEGSPWSASGFQIAPESAGASPTVLYFFSEDPEGSTNAEAKGADAEWVLYEGAYEAVPAPA